MENDNNNILLSDIVIKERYRKDFGDIDTLADNIATIGLLQPIVINENNELIDGQRRILAYHQLGREEIPCFKIDLEKIVLGEFSANHYRKEWTVSEMVQIKRAIEPYIKKKAEQREHAGKKIQPCADSAQGESGRTRDIVADFLGKGRDYIAKAEIIFTAAEKEPELYQPILI